MTNRKPARTTISANFQDTGSRQLMRWANLRQRRRTAADPPLTTPSSSSDLYDADDIGISGALQKLKAGTSMRNDEERTSIIRLSFRISNRAPLRSPDRRIGWQGVRARNSTTYHGPQCRVSSATVQRFTPRQRDGQCPFADRPSAGGRAGAHSRHHARSLQQVSCRTAFFRLDFNVGSNGKLLTNVQRQANSPALLKRADYLIQPPSSCFGSSPGPDRQDRTDAPAPGGPRSGDRLGTFERDIGGTVRTSSRFQRWNAGRKRHQHRSFGEKRYVQRTVIVIR